ncbi:MAG: hypothetical protein A3A10_02820 [Candidatus Tagabacteria bacterium RIFCSPLOWO2_01_FULL_42_9]|uniref:Ubiquitin-like domain-containing protein n=1 Tax=Candidatus Tagabacteria bacterium RIFCSPLOWO2_01_FULL_42_9 TaxID=1802296 RepID=A0A1G2LTN5_9BACT|nr:MAG: hypothetical protein A3A10_02820 [Candidatus Tagabacteria bacterium RIFCSPLOWO2_01_FULL_42_9]
MKTEKEEAMGSFPVKVVDPNRQVVDTFYVVPPNTKVIDALKASGKTDINADEEAFLNGKPVNPDEELLPGDTVEIAKREIPVITVLPKQSGGKN